jgi:predicted nucleic acid-binding Zn ribbon protein
MKAFRKNELGLYICEECEKSFVCKENVSKHVKHHNMSVNEYYNKWCKEDGDCHCQECGKEISLTRKYCSMKCKLLGAAKAKSVNAKNKRELAYDFVCKECNEKFESSIKLKNHIIKKHDIKNYYDAWLKKENEEFCKICGKETKFSGRYTTGYEMCCSKECREIYRLSKRSKTNIEKYGVPNVYQRKDIKEKIKQSFIIRYGVDNNMKSKNGKAAYSKAIRAKYGVDWPLQNKDILEKGQKSAKTLKQFNESLWYQGTYELDFLEKYYLKYPDIVRGPSIKYGNKIYHPDFYIPSLNLIIEIKSTWTLDKNEEKLKKKATITNGFNYIMILDKDYNDFSLSWCPKMA